MEKQDFIERMSQIGTCTDDVERRELITSLSEEVQNDYDRITELSEADSKHKEEIDKLQKANMNLFLRVSENKTPEQQGKDETGIENKKEEKRSFADLFDEKGGIK